MTILPGQAIQPGGEALLSFKDKSLILQRPVSEEMFYMCQLSGMVSFGGNARKLSWWYRVFTQQRISRLTPTIQLFSFSTLCVNEIMDEILKSMEECGLFVEEKEGEDGDVVYEVKQPKIIDISPVSPTNAPTNAQESLTPDDGAPGVRRVTWSGQGVSAPPKDLIQQLRSRHAAQSKSQSDLTQPSAEETSPSKRAILPPLPAQRRDVSPSSRPALPVPPALRFPGKLPPTPPSPPWSPPVSPPTSPAPSPCTTPESTPPNTLAIDMPQRTPPSPRLRPQKPHRTAVARARHTQMLAKEDSPRSPQPDSSKAFPPSPESPSENNPCQHKPTPVPRARSKSKPNEKSLQEQRGMSMLSVFL